MPFNPAYPWTRKYIISPLENIEYNQVINSGENATLYATNSIKLLPGFKAEIGSTFKADISVAPNDIVCLPNPAKNVILKSSKIEQNTITQNIEVNKIEISNNINNSSVIIFPNPNKGNFTINISDNINPNASIEIFNLSGQILHKETIRSCNQNVIFTNKSGTYIVKVQNGNSIFTEKIILQK